MDGDSVNFAFWLLIIIVIVVVWFLLGFIFKPVGRIAHKIFSDVADIISEEDSTPEQEEKEGVSNER